jgi:type II restriction/modification system DNA methylase subunit YeeA
MTPQAFIAKWQNNPLTERAGAQAHFEDLCALLGVEPPRQPGEYQYERGAKKSDGSDGWADVWKRAHFGWENKQPGRDLDKALKQLTDYALKLDNPPLLVVCDRERIIIHTAFTGYPDEPREIRIEELTDPGKLQILRWVFTDPEKLRPEKSTAAITAEAAGQFSSLAKAMRARGLDGQRVAHFLVQCLFCMFAEDEDLLPDSVFTKLLDKAATDTERAENRLTALFKTMQQGGDYGDHDLAWFNGSLFKTVDIPPLTTADLAALHHAAADMDWRAIDPTIFGTLFERSLDPAARAPLGAHYTDTGTIGKLIEPLITAPLLAEWERIKPAIGARMAKSKKLNDKAHKDAAALFQGHIAHLSNFRVLDPACGSGNFLYLALKALRDVEKLAHVEAQEMGIHAELALQTGPHNILGIEINEFAAELARVTVWIGDIQWCRRNGYPHGIKPILKPLDGIEHRDALLNPDGTEAEWPQADVIVGNPPFLGGSKMRGELGDAYVERLRKRYEGRVPGGADLVTYWFEKARAQIETGKAQRAGLVATQAIRGGSNRKVLERILKTLPIFEAWSDEAWVNNGAAVRVSLVCFGRSTVGCAVRTATEGARGAPYLNGQPVSEIYADLTAPGASGDAMDLTQAKPLAGNAGTSFEGTKKYGDFDIPGETARAWLKLPNPNGRSNANVVKPWANGKDITARPSDTWIIDYGTDMTEANAALYETPFGHVLENVKSQRKDAKWWSHERPRPELRKALNGLPRFIVTPRVAKHRFFVWLSVGVLPDTRLNVIASDSDTSFGILSSRIHEVWSLAQASMHGVGNDPTYNAKSCFETFLPLPRRPDACPEPRRRAARHRIRHSGRRRNPVQYTGGRSPPLDPGVRRGDGPSHHRRREATQRPARSLAQPAGMGGLGGDKGRRTGRLPAAPRRQARP